MPRYINVDFDTDEFDELVARKPADMTWREVIRRGVEAANGGESA